MGEGSGQLAEAPRIELWLPWEPRAGGGDGLAHRGSGLLVGEGTGPAPAAGWGAVQQQASYLFHVLIEEVEQRVGAAQLLPLPHVLVPGAIGHWNGHGFH